MEVSGSRENHLEDKSTPLHIACHAGHVELVSELLSAGAALDARAQVRAVADDEMSDESESDFSLGSQDTSALCLCWRPCGGGLCVVVSWGCS
jgi:ankyrin repeat protein